MIRTDMITAVLVEWIEGERAREGTRRPLREQIAGRGGAHCAHPFDRYLLSESTIKRKLLRRFVVPFAPYRIEFALTLGKRKDSSPRNSGKSLAEKER